MLYQCQIDKLSPNSFLSAAAITPICYHIRPHYEDSPGDIVVKIFTLLCETSCPLFYCGEMHFHISSRVTERVTEHYYQERVM